MNARAAIKDLAARLYPFAYSIASRDSDRAVAVFQEELPFRVHEWPVGAELNGWVVPPAWEVEAARILRGGELVWDGCSSPLGVSWLSPSFSGEVELDELKRHLFYDAEHPDAVTYRWEPLYRPDERQWGFSLPKRLYDAFSPGRYQVDLKTRFDERATMKALDFILPGESPRTLLINAHNCHPFQANDDISGCAVGIRLMQRLAELPRGRMTYRLVIAPELIGTAFWLNGLGEAARNIEGVLLLKSVGNDAALKLQESFTGASRMDRAAHHVMRLRYGAYASGPFRTVYGNDETVFEAPGYEIPTVSLTRMPFFGYHTDQDTPERLFEERLQDCVETAFQLCRAVEAKDRFLPKFRGLVSLSNPRYGLYKPRSWTGETDQSALAARWFLFMNCLPRYMDGSMTVFDMAERHGLPIEDVVQYLDLWVEKGLAERLSSS